MDQDIVKRFLEKKPFDEELGLAGRGPKQDRMRELLGSTGGSGSYQVDAAKVSPTPVVTGEPGGGGTSPTIPGIIITFAGTAYYNDLNGVTTGPV
jgi:hypothetical protein